MYPLPSGFQMNIFGHNLIQPLSSNNEKYAFQIIFDTTANMLYKASLIRKKIFFTITKIYYSEGLL